MAPSLEELEALITNAKAIIQYHRTNLSRRDFVERSISDHKKTIAGIQRQIDALEDSLVNGEDHITEAKLRLKSLTQQHLVESNRRDIEKLLALADKLQGVQS